MKSFLKSTTTVTRMQSQEGRSGMWLYLGKRKLNTGVWFSHWDEHTNHGGNLPEQGPELHPSPRELVSGEGSTSQSVV